MSFRLSKDCFKINLSFVGVAGFEGIKKQDNTVKEKLTTKI